jgi:hypothetical protein
MSSFGLKELSHVALLAGDARVRGTDRSHELARRACAPWSYRPVDGPLADWPAKENPMKILGWIIGIIFLIGLLVVIGAGKLIF